MKTVTVARWISLIAAFVVGAVAEWKLGVAVGWDPYTAALLPLVLDVWGFAAFRTGRTWHVTGALGAMFATQTVSHLLELGEGPALMVALSIAVSAIPPAVSLACHRLGVESSTVDAPAETVTASPRVVETTTATPERDGYRPTFAIVDEVHDWTPPVDAPAETVDVPVTATVDTVDAADVAPSKAQLAAEGAALMAQGMTKTAAAEALGITRQWLHKCMKEYA